MSAKGTSKSANEPLSWQPLTLRICKAGNKGFAPKNSGVPSKASRGPEAVPAKLTFRSFLQQPFHMALIQPVTAVPAKSNSSKWSNCITTAISPVTLVFPKLNVLRLVRSCSAAMLPSTLVLVSFSS